MDSRKCQAATASPAQPGDLPIGLDKSGKECLTKQNKSEFTLLGIKTNSFCNAKFHSIKRKKQASIK
jgi:hypothetical protein